MGPPGRAGSSTMTSAQRPARSPPCRNMSWSGSVLSGLWAEAAALSFLRPNGAHRASGRIRTSGTWQQDRTPSPH